MNFRDKILNKNIIIHDCIVAGVGIAGVSVLRSLFRGQYKKLNLLGLEASERVGGRLKTIEVNSFGENFLVDAGGAWIHDEAVEDKKGVYWYFTNPIEKIAKRLRMHSIAEDEEVLVFHNKQPLAPEIFYQKCQETFDIIRDNLDQSITVYQSLQSWISQSKLHYHIAVAEHGGAESAADIDKISARDYWNTLSRTSGKLLAEGLGTLVNKSAQKLIDANIIKFNSKITAVEWCDDLKLIKITTQESEKDNASKDNKIYYTKTFVNTLPISVLRSGSIKFDDKTMPKSKLQAIQKIEMGLLNKIILPTSSEFFSKNNIKDNTHLHIYDDEANRTDFYFTKPNGKNVIIMLVGGEVAWNLEKLTKQEQINYAISGLKNAFGDDVEKYIDIKNCITTEWGKSECSLGAYTYVTPNNEIARKELAKPVIIEGKPAIFFAGEAVKSTYKYIDLYTHCAGAYVSAINAANKIRDVFKQVAKNIGTGLY